MINKFVPELEGCKIINGKYSKNIAIFSVFINNEYKKYIFKFDKTLSEYELRVIEDCDDTTINMVVLPNGVVVHIPKDGELEVFQNERKVNSITQVQDLGISMDMKLTNNGMSVLFSKNEMLYSIKLT